MNSRSISKNTQACTSLGVAWFCPPLSLQLLQSDQGREKQEGFWPQGICTCCSFYLVHAYTLCSYGLLIFIHEISSQISLPKIFRGSPNLRQFPRVWSLIGLRSFSLIPGPNSYLFSYLLKVCLSHQRMRLEASSRIFFFSLSTLSFQCLPCGDPQYIFQLKE